MATPLEDRAQPGSGFATTRWSLIAAAQKPGSPQARQALADLCRLYWYPLYAYVRRKGHSHADAEDLTQEFFARLLEKDGLAGVSVSRGCFRSFLLAACQHFLANEWDRARARKRGGGRHALSLDFADAEGRYLRDVSHDETPERLFERRWGLALLQQVLQRLKGEYDAAGKGRLFEALKGSLLGEGKGAGYAEVGEALGMREGAVKVAAHRLRRRYRELLRDEIGQTVASAEGIDEEIQALFTALGK